jgi:hypothetical protein
MSCELNCMIKTLMCVLRVVFVQLKQQLKDIEVDRVNSERVLQEMTSALAAAESKNVTSTTTNAASSPDLQATLQVKVSDFVLVTFNSVLMKEFHVRCFSFVLLDQ